uniref:Uncharacterized protein n=1 Tax=Rhodnius prolixus TaxID=13249 RepID=T1HG59_RHOPR
MKLSSLSSSKSSDEEEKRKIVQKIKVKDVKKRKRKPQNEQTAQIIVEKQEQEPIIKLPKEFKVYKVADYNRLLKQPSLRSKRRYLPEMKGTISEQPPSEPSVELKTLLDEFFPSEKSFLETNQSELNTSSKQKQKLMSIRKITTDENLKSRVSDQKKEKPIEEAESFKPNKKVKFTGFLKCIFEEYLKKKKKRKKERKQEILEMNGFKRKEKRFISKHLRLLTKRVPEGGRLRPEKLHKRKRRENRKKVDMEWWMWMIRNAKTDLKKQNVEIKKSTQANLEGKDSDTDDIKDQVKVIHSKRKEKPDTLKDPEMLDIEEKQNWNRLEFQMEWERDLDEIELLSKVNFLKEMKRMCTKEEPNREEQIKKLKFLKCMERQWLGSKIDLVGKDEVNKKEGWDTFKINKNKTKELNKEKSIESLEEPEYTNKNTFASPCNEASYLEKMKKCIYFWDDMYEEKAKLKEESFRNKEVIAFIKFAQRELRKQTKKKPSIAEISVYLAYLQFKKEQLAYLARKEIKNIVGASDEEVNVLNKKLHKVKKLVRENNWDPKYLPALVVLSKKVNSINKNKGKIKAEMLDYYLDGVRNLIKVIRTITKQLFVSKVEDKIFYNKTRKIVNETKIFLIRQIQVFDYLKSVLMNLDWNKHYYVKIRILRKLDCFIQKIERQNYRFDEELSELHKLQARLKRCRSLSSAISERQSDASSSTF